MNDIVIPSTAKQIQTQKILHEYRDRMLGENLKTAVATIDPDILQSEIAKFVNKDCRMILQGLSIREETMFALLFFLSRFFADIIYVLHDFIEPFCNGNQIFLIRFVENDLILPMLLHAGFQVVALDGPGDTAEVFVGIHMGSGP